MNFSPIRRLMQLRECYPGPLVPRDTSLVLKPSVMKMPRRDGSKLTNRLGSLRNDAKNVKIPLETSSAYLHAYFKGVLLLHAINNGVRSALLMLSAGCRSNLHRNPAQVLPIYITYCTNIGKCGKRYIPMIEYKVSNIVYHKIF